jgi:hypothetical protein
MRNANRAQRSGAGVLQQAAGSDGDKGGPVVPVHTPGNPNNRASHYMEGIGRLKACVSPEQANSDLSAILSQLANEHPGDKGWRVFVVPHMLLVLLARWG